VLLLLVVALMGAALCQGDELGCLCAHSLHVGVKRSLSLCAAAATMHVSAVADCFPLIGKTSLVVITIT